MARETLPEALRLMFGHEGGYSNNKSDPGGPTKYGITHRTLAAHRGEPSVTAAHVKALTLKEAEASVNAERQRRILAGTVINGVHVTGRDEDARNLTNLALAAQIRIASGDTTTPTVYRDGQNIDHELTPPQMLALWQQSAAYVSALYAASWAIKAMEPLPEDVTADELWPART